MRTTWQRVGEIPGLPVSVRQRIRRLPPPRPGGGLPVLDASPQPMGSAEVTQAYLSGMSGTRQPPVRDYPAQRPGRRAQIW